MAFCPPLNRTCYKVSTVRDEWGDRIMGTTVELACHFRQIDRFDRVFHQEESDADAMVWFSGTTNVSNGDSILFQGVYYQIDKIVKAVRLGSDTVEFIKCELTVTDLGIS